MSEIPIGIVEKILQKLPVISLIRFQSVCKSWHHIINDPRFLLMHHKHTIQWPQNEDDLFIAELNEYKFPHIDVIKLEDQAFVPRMLNIPQEIAFAYLVGSCHGITLLRKYNLQSFVLLNPITRKQYEIHCLHDCLCSYGLYHDPKSDDYKIAILYIEVEDDTFYYRVYSCKNTSWQEPKAFPSTMIPQDERVVFFDGCFYRCGDGEILCFDVRDEKLTKVSFPHDYIHTNHEVLIELSRSLCMYTILPLEDGSGQWIRLWKMEKNGEIYSWRKMMDVETNNHVFLFRFVCLSKNDDVVVNMIRTCATLWWVLVVEMIYHHSEMKLKIFNKGGFKPTITLSYSETLYFPILLSSS